MWSKDVSSLGGPHYSIYHNKDKIKSHIISQLFLKVIKDDEVVLKKYLISSNLPGNLEDPPYST